MLHNDNNNDIIFYNTVLHVREGACVRALTGVRACGVCVRARIYACIIFILYYYICGCSLCVRVCVRSTYVGLHANVYICIRVCGRMCVRDCTRARVRMCAYVCA